MGKWTDKLYITHSEWSGEVGQHSASAGITGQRKSSGFKRLPFYCCSLSLQPSHYPLYQKIWYQPSNRRKIRN
jgi:peptidyl-prolyl cis-trans isomerase-like protein 2